ncbi:hypothetical protein Hanom_Chr01g00084611 [Helianthus anomalus]
MEPGPSIQTGLNRDVGLGLNMIKVQQKPNDEAAGLQKGSELGSAEAGRSEYPPLGAAGLQSMGLNVNRPILAPNISREESGSPGMHDAVLKNDGPILEKIIGPNVKSKGSGFFDVTKQAFESGPSPNVSTKNSFGTLRDEEECFDTELGLWENEVEVVKKFVESNTRPKLEDYDSWSANMKKYYDGLTKINEDDEVASETDEMARFMKSGVSRLSMQMHLFVILVF